MSEETKTVHRREWLHRDDYEGGAESYVSLFMAQHPDAYAQQRYEEPELSLTSWNCVDFRLNNGYTSVELSLTCSDTVTSTRSLMVVDTILSVLHDARCLIMSVRAHQEQFELEADEE